MSLAGGFLAVVCVLCVVWLVWAGFVEPIRRQRRMAKWNGNARAARYATRGLACGQYHLSIGCPSPDNYAAHHDAEVKAFIDSNTDADTDGEDD